MYDAAPATSRDTRKGWELPTGLFGLRSAAASLPDLSSEYYIRYPDDDRHIERVYANFRDCLSLIGRNRPQYSSLDLREALGHLSRAKAFWQGILDRNSPPQRMRNEWAMRAEINLKRVAEAKSILEVAAARQAA